MLTDVMIFHNKLNYFPSNVPIILENETCVYCGIQLSLTSATKEHVIGRRFVPKGKLNAQWNLIGHACKECNRKKSDLEDDISAISMQADAWGMHSLSDSALATEAARKAKNSISRRTRKLVKDSSEKINIKGTFTAGVEFTFNITSPPQIESDRIYELARMQLMAFFYLITYNQKTKRGGFWLGSFFPVLESIRSDWGNTIHKAFMDAVVDWEPRIIAIGADGFFKAIIRRHPDAICWSWALEWNHKYRIIGFFGEQEPVKNIVATFPMMKVPTLYQGPNQYVSFRIEKALADIDDTLFYWENNKDANDE